MQTSTTSSPALSRRSFAKLALAGSGALALGGALAGGSQPADEGDGADTEVAADGASGETPDAGHRDHAAPALGALRPGFDPLVSWGCGEHVHEPLIQSTLIVTNADIELLQRPGAPSYSSAARTGSPGRSRSATTHVFSDGEPLTAADVAFTINGILALSRPPKPTCPWSTKAVAPGDYARWSLHAQHARSTSLLVHAGRRRHRARARPRRRLRHQPHRQRAATCSTQWDQGQQVIFDGQPRPTTARHRGSSVSWCCSWTRTPRSPRRSRGQVDVAYTSATFSRRSSPGGYDLFACDDGRLARHLAALTVPAGWHQGRESGGVSYAAGNDVTSDLARAAAP